MSTLEQPATTVAPAGDADRLQRRSHPRTEYWDYMTASWRTASPIPAPRRGQ